MKIIFALTVVIVLRLFTGCSPVSSDGGGSSSEVVAVVQGTIVSENGTAVAGASVMLIPSEYNIVTAAGGGLVYEAESDQAGRYTLNDVKGGIYNFYASNNRNGTKALTLAIAIDENKISLPDNVLRSVSTVKISLAGTIDTADGYVYMNGTAYSRSLTGAVALSDGSYALVLDSVPAGQLPSIIYATKQDSASLVIGNAIVTEPGDTAFVNIDRTLKPVWTYPLTVGLTAKTAAYFRDMDSTGKLVEAYIAAINGRFNDTGPFSGVVRFRVDSMYIFDGSCIDEINKPMPSGFFQRLILNGYPDNGNESGWFNDQRTVYEAAQADQLFGKHSIDAAAWQFGLACGCIPLSYMVVPAEKNPVNHASFTGGSYFMYKPYECTAWDPYNIAALNHYAARPPAKSCQGITGYPASIGIAAEYENGTPVADAAVTLFGVKWQSYAVTDTVISYTTDASGVAVFSGNPYNAGSDGATVYCNFLIRATVFSDTAYAWLPIDEIGVAWFENPYGNFRKAIRFKGGS